MKLVEHKEEPDAIKIHQTVEYQWTSNLPGAPHSAEIGVVLHHAIRSNRNRKKWRYITIDLPLHLKVKLAELQAITKEPVKRGRKANG